MKSRLNQAHPRATHGNPRANHGQIHGQNAPEPAPPLILAKTTGMTPSYVRTRTWAHMRTRARARASTPYVPWYEYYQRVSGVLPVDCPWIARGFSDGVNK